MAIVNNCKMTTVFITLQIQINYKQKKRVLVPRKECIVIEGSHEAIINKSEFYKVQEILNKRNHMK